MLRRLLLFIYRVFVVFSTYLQFDEYMRITKRLAFYIIIHEKLALPSTLTLGKV